MLELHATNTNLQRLLLIHVQHSYSTSGCEPGCPVVRGCGTAGLRGHMALVGLDRRRIEDPVNPVIGLSPRRALFDMFSDLLEAHIARVGRRAGQLPHGAGRHAELATACTAEPGAATVEWTQRCWAHGCSAAAACAERRRAAHATAAASRQWPQNAALPGLPPRLRPRRSLHACKNLPAVRNRARGAARAAEARLAAQFVNGSIEVCYLALQEGLRPLHRVHLLVDLAVNVPAERPRAVHVGFGFVA